MDKKSRIIRKEIRERLNKFRWACELSKTIKHYFPTLMPQLKTLTDEQDERYIKYELAVVLCVRILSSVFMLASMRSTTVELNNDVVIENISKLFIRSKAFLDSRINKQYWQVLIDGSGLYSFKERHCEHCLFREYSKDWQNRIC